MNASEDMTKPGNGGGTAIYRRKTRRARYRVVRSVLSGLLVLGTAALLAGFFEFTVEVRRSGPAADPVADGIVVLTGGRERVEKALMLLAEGRAKRLLISGVHPSASLDTLLRLSNADQALSDSIDLDYLANNTIGNAAEAAKWTDDQGFRTIILVTSNYHMPRSLLEFRAELPGVDIVPYAVVRPDLNFSGWYLDFGTTRFLAAEYLKYLAAQVRTSFQA